MDDIIKYECKYRNCNNDAVLEVLEPIKNKSDYWKHNAYFCDSHFGVMFFDGRIPRSWRMRNLYDYRS